MIDDKSDIRMVENRDPRPPIKSRDRVSPGDLTLCLSGGGFRAAVYHLGVARRLHELGILGQVRRISCVSGGSILGAFLLQRYPPFQGRSLSNFDWASQIEVPFCRLVCKRDLRTWPLLRRWGLTALLTLMTGAWLVQTLVLWISTAFGSGRSVTAGMVAAGMVLLVLIVSSTFFGARAAAISLLPMVTIAIAAGTGISCMAVCAGLVAVAMPCALGATWGLTGAAVLSLVAGLQIELSRLAISSSPGVPLAWALGNALVAVLLAAWAVGHPSSSVESLCQLYAKHLAMGDDRDLDQIVPAPVPLAFCFNATDIIFGARWVAERYWRKDRYSHRVGSYRAGYVAHDGTSSATPLQKWSLARAVAASSCFPPVFGPLKIGWPASAYRRTRYAGTGKTVADRQLDRQRKLEAMMVNDGGNYGNLGLLAAERSRLVIVSDGGAPLDYSPPESSFQLLGRYGALLMSVNANQRIRELLKAFQSSGRARKQGIIARIGRRLDDEKSTPEAASRQWNARCVARIRTDLAPLTSVEFHATEELGYVSADEKIENFAVDVLPVTNKAPAAETRWIDDPTLDRKLAWSHRRLIAPWLRRLLAGQSPVAIAPKAD